MVSKATKKAIELIGRREPLEEIRLMTGIPVETLTHMRGNIVKTKTAEFERMYPNQANPPF